MTGHLSGLLNGIIKRDGTRLRLAAKRRRDSAKKNLRPLNSFENGEPQVF